MSRPADKEIFVQHFVDRRHFYSVSAVRAHFVAALAGEELEDFATRQGTAFIVSAGDKLRFVTNRHVLDYNFKRPKADVIPSAALKSVEIIGHGQPSDLSQPTIQWSFKATDAAFHPDGVTDLAVMSIERDNFTPPLNNSPDLRDALSRYDLSFLADESQIALLTPGEDVFIVGYPGLVGDSDRPVLVKGTIASDPRYPATFGNAELDNAVLCHSFSWHGMSGAPVLGFSGSLGETKIIGINAGHVGGSGITGGVISHFVRSSALIGLLEVTTST